MTEQQIKQEKFPGIKIHEELIWDEVIGTELIELQNKLEFQKIKETFFKLANKYIKYGGEWNINKVLKFLEQLDFSNLWRIFNYLDIQISRISDNKKKMKLMCLKKIIIDWEKNRIVESKKILYERHSKIIDGKITLTDDKNWEQKSFKLISSPIEFLPNGYWITLNYGEGGLYYFHVDTSDKSLVVKDEHNTPIKCNVELLNIDMRKENIGLWQIRIINIKKYRVQIWSQYFILAFND